MAKVQWSAGIDSVSGALAKPGSNPQHSCEHMLLGTHRKAATTSKDCNRLYLRKKVQYTMAQTESAIWARNRFTAVSQAIKVRSRNLTYLTEDQQAFLAQRNNVGGKKTMKAYYWYICGQEYDQQHPRN